jgi:hypothetical protein
VSSSVVVGSNLVNEIFDEDDDENIMDYTSSLHANLTYTDLIDAHSLSNEIRIDSNQKVFSSVGELKSFRHQDNLEPLTESASLQYLKRESLKENEQANKRAYQLHKETEKYHERKQLLDSAFRQIKN